MFQKKLEYFLWHVIMENLNYENESMERKYLKIWKNQFLKAKNSILELEKDFIELKDTELKDVEVKLKER